MSSALVYDGFSRDRREERRYRTSWSEEKAKGGFGPLTLSQVFLPLVAAYLLANQWFKMNVASVLANRVNGRVAATLTYQVERLPFMLGGISIKESDRFGAIMTDVLSEINENQDNVVQLSIGLNQYGQ